MDPVDVAQIVLLALVLVSSILFPLLIYIRVMKSLRSQISQMTSRLDQNLGAGAKLLEVRDYYQQAAAALKRMLDEAYREGNRARQDEIRKLLDRLEAMKARTLDKSVAILEATNPNVPRSKRRRSRRPRGRRRPRPGNGPRNSSSGPPKST